MPTKDDPAFKVQLIVNRDVLARLAGACRLAGELEAHAGDAKAAAVLFMYGEQFNASREAARHAG